MGVGGCQVINLSKEEIQAFLFRTSSKKFEKQVLKMLHFLQKQLQCSIEVSSPANEKSKMVFQPLQKQLLLHKLMYLSLVIRCSHGFANSTVQQTLPA